MFEGEIRPSELKKLKESLKKAVIAELDSIVIYEFASMNYINRDVIGIDKNENIFS